MENKTNPCTSNIMIDYTFIYVWYAHIHAINCWHVTPIGNQVILYK